MGHCEDCKFYEGHTLTENHDGICFRYPPIYCPESHLSFFTEVNKDWHCGEFKPKEVEEKQRRKEFGPDIDIRGWVDLSGYKW